MSLSPNRERRLEELLQQALCLPDRWESAHPDAEPQDYGARRAVLQASYNALRGAEGPKHEAVTT